MKRKLTFLATVILILVLMLAFVSCGSESNDPGSNDSGNTDSGNNDSGNNDSGNNGGNGGGNISVPDTGIGGLAYEYDSIDGGYYISGKGTCALTELTLPSEYEGKPVIGIRQYAFESSDITSVYIPSSIKKITRAFYLCESLTTVTLENGITSVDGEAFYSCSKLSEIVLPDSITEIRVSAFANCTELSKITLSKSLKIIDDKAFEGCSKLAEISIPESVTDIGSDAFKDCSLTAVTISDSLLSRNYYSFVDTPYYTAISSTENGLNYVGNILVGYDPNATLETVVLKDSTTIIAGGALSNCQTIKSITLNDGLKEIHYEAFYNCKNLSEINIPDTVEQIGADIITNTAYYKSAAQETIYIGNHLIRILGKKNVIEDLTVREGTLTIADEASGTTTVSAINIPASVKYIGEGAFDISGNLEAINVSEENNYYSSVDGVLYNKDKSILLRCPTKKSGLCIIPDGTQIVRQYAFSTCTGIDEIVIPTSVSVIEDNAFEVMQKISVFYCGTMEEFDSIAMSSNAYGFNTQSMVYYSDEWTMVEGKPVKN